MSETITAPMVLGLRGPGLTGADAAALDGKVTAAQTAKTGAETAEALSKAWAQSTGNPDPSDPTSKSAMAWASALAYLASPIRKFTTEAGGQASWRFRVGNRLYGTFDATLGFYFRKLRIAANATIDDNTSISLGQRLLAGAIGSNFKRLPAELTASKGAMRWRVGNRLLATLDVINGLYPRRMTLPASAKVDDDLSANIVTRLVPPGLGSYLARLPLEAGGVLRFRLGHRLLGQWSNASGMFFTRMTLPADVKLNDQPTVNLTDRLGGGLLTLVDTASYVVSTYVDAATSKKRVRSIRKSDMHQFNGLSGSTYNATVQAVTADGHVIYYVDALNYHLHVPVEGGAAWRAFSDLAVIDCWGDSLTAGAGSTGSGPGQGSYPKQLSDRMNANGVTVTINNRGVGGQTSTHIAARQNGIPALISVTGNQIPASGAVAVSAYSTDLLYNSGTSGSLALTGTLAGVPGVLSGTPTSGIGTAPYTFTRTTAGSAVNCPANTPFITDLGAQTQERTGIYKAGRNGGSFPTDLAAMIAYLKTYYKRLLVLSIQNGPTEAGTSTQTTFMAYNATLASTYGDSYVETNLAPTTEEMAAIGFVPDSYGVYSNFHTDAADLAGKASGGWTFTANPTANDTVSLGGSTITFVASGAVGAQVTIGADAVATAASLASYINANSTSLGVTAVSGTDILGTTRCNIASTAAGTASNSVTIAKSSTALTVSGATLSNGTANPLMPSGMLSAASATTGDWLHRNNLGYALEALRVYRKMYAKGWFPTLIAA